MRQFNTTGLCVPEDDYMVDISDRLKIMKEMVDEGKYFTINCGRQYGKTTTLTSLERYLQDEYMIISMDFQEFGESSYETEEKFCRDFTEKFCEIFYNICSPGKEGLYKLVSEWVDYSQTKGDDFRFVQLFRFIKKMCIMNERPVVLFIDEVDSAANNQVFLDFLAQLRSLYLKRKKNPQMKTFQSVILAGVTDVKHLKRKIHPDEVQKVNSPWNIAADFTLDMNFSTAGIAGMLFDYEKDHHTGMDVEKAAREIRDYTGGYPFLVCRICQILDKELVKTKRFPNLSSTWTSEGISEAVRILVSESNTLFDSLMGKVINNSEMNEILESMLFSGESIVYNRYNLAISDALMYGFICIEENIIKVANRIFEMLLYNYYLSESKMQSSSIYRAGSHNRERFIRGGQLDMDMVLERFTVSFDELYGDIDEKFNEEEGRRKFLLYIRPIINGTGNYYVETRTRNNKRMDVVIDYLGERFVVELKIWRGNAYNERGEEQLLEYLDYFHLQKGYMLSYNFNQNKKVGMKTIVIGEKILVEAVV